MYPFKQLAPGKRRGGKEFKNKSMSDPVVEELLKQWGVPQLLDRCKEQEVDLDALRSFKENVITELVPLIGPRCKFLKGWRAWKELGAPAPGSTPSTAPGATTPRTGVQGAQDGGSPTHSPNPPEQLQVAPPKRTPIPVVAATPSPSAPSTSRKRTMEESGPSDSGRKEVAVFLQGRISYEDGDSSSGWLVADGYLKKGQSVTVKMEPADDLAADDAEDIDSPKRPRFQLQGRISLSLQDFAEVPSYMVAQGAQASPSTPHLEDSCSMPCDGFVPPAYMQQMQQMQQMHQDVHPEAASPMAFASVGSSFSRKRSRSDKLDLEMLLNSTSKGKMILSLYRQRNCLDGPARQTLTDLVIAEELREDFNKRITSQRFQEIAEAIVELFPGENEDTYFCNDRSYGDRPGGKGKLTSKYYNTRRQLAKSGVICRGQSKERRQNIQQGILAAFQSTSEEHAEALQNSKWLQSLGWHTELSPEDLEMTLQRWQGCWKVRLLKVLSPGHSPTVYLDEYPVLRMPIGETLIKSDFDLLFKEAGTRLMRDWPNFSQSVITTLAEDYRKQIPLLDTVRRHVGTVEGRQVGALLLLPSMLPVTTCKGSGESSEIWRPTRQEAQDGFLLHVEHDGDVNAALERHWMRMRLMGQAVSPVPVVVGPTLDQLQTALVAIDENTAFYVPSALCAVDLCFKCFHALQVPYPPQAQNVWMFLQHALYQVATPTDRMSVSVSSLLADFGFRPVAPVASWDQVLNPSGAGPPGPAAV